MYDTAKLFLGGLNSEATEDDIRSYFSQFGKLTDVIVMREPATGISRRFGFVTFESHEECMNCFNSKPHSVRESVVDVKLAQPKDAQNKMPTPMRRIHPDSDKKVFIGGLSHSTTNESLRAYFGQFGEITDAIVMKHPETQRPRGFGFVTYVSQSCVDTLQRDRPHVVDGATVETKRAVPKEEAGPKNCTKLFIGGIKEETTESDIRNHFSQFGVVTKIDIKVDKSTGRKRGFVFVDFEDYDAVDKVLLTAQHVICNKNVDVKKAVPREEQFNAGMGGGMNPGYGYAAPPSMGRGGGRGAPPAMGGYSSGYGQQQGWGGYPQSAAPASDGQYGSYGGYSSGYGTAPTGWDSKSWQQSPASAGAPGAAAPGSWDASPNPAGGYGMSPSFGRGGPMRNGVRGAARPTPYARGAAASAGAARGGGW